MHCELTWMTLFFSFSSILCSNQLLFSCLKYYEVMLFSVLTETKCSLLARTELGNQKDQSSNGTMNARAELANQQGHYSNGITNHIILPTSRTSQMVTSMVATSSNDLPRVSALPQHGDNKPITWDCKRDFSSKSRFKGCFCIWSN